MENLVGCYIFLLNFKLKQGTIEEKSGIGLHNFDSLNWMAFTLYENQKEK